MSYDSFGYAAGVKLQKHVEELRAEVEEMRAKVDALVRLLLLTRKELGK